MSASRQADADAVLVALIEAHPRRPQFRELRQATGLGHEELREAITALREQRRVVAPAGELAGWGLTADGGPS